MRGTLTAERVIGAALVAFAGLFALVRSNRSAAFDLAATLKFQSWDHPMLASVMRVASWPGFPPQSRLIPPAIIGAWLVARRPRAAAFQLAAWGGAVISTVLKEFIQRPRPLPPAVRVIVAPLGGTSFPSGHVLTYVAFYGFLGFLLADQVRSEPVRAVSVAGLSTLVTLVGPSRIQQGHHWTTDVVASYLLGLAYLFALVELYRATTATSLFDRLVAR
jgi:membrane-associated phospholipid phosphatase